jgi:hypothetical protein
MSSSFSTANINEEYFLYVRRHMQFLHIWTVYFDLLSGRYVPSVGYTEFSAAESNSALPGHMVPTLMGLLYAFFYSLIEDSDDSINAFRIWRLKYPDTLQLTLWRSESRLCEMISEYFVTAWPSTEAGLTSTRRAHTTSSAINQERR